ncbi:hypothetical protein QBC44DRAFT_374930 [Cladorrhinum sp. PSN332]|nr:hypothetical protein QBC44DRAFT_374930 [Cladorrhinum sp. PSN332]
MEQPRSGLLSVPVEIRLMILSHLYGAGMRYLIYTKREPSSEHATRRSTRLSNRKIPRHQYSYESRRPRTPIKASLYLVRVMMMMSKQLSKEVAYHFYSQNIFAVQPKHLSTWIRRIGPENSKSIRNIVLRPSNPAEEFPIWHNDYEQDEAVQAHRLRKAAVWQLAQRALAEDELPGLREIRFELTPTFRSSHSFTDYSYKEVDHVRLITALTSKSPASGSWRPTFQHLSHIIFEFPTSALLSELEILPYVEACKFWQVDVFLLTDSIVCTNAELHMRRVRRRTSMVASNRVAVTRAMVTTTAPNESKKVRIQIRWKEVRDVDAKRAADEIVQRYLTLEKLRVEHDLT